ncbi:ATP-binding cassette sub- A member 5 [Nowakowskiella sp. JEL0407]|nr:ATP-binding cassette sub- A member 5 [Nowakowskiella sp. JEL0407]
MCFTTLWQQSKAMFWRNAVLAKSDRNQMFTECGIPILLSVVIFIIGFTTNLQTTLPAFRFDPTPINTKLPFFRNTAIVGYTPSSNETSQIVEKLNASSVFQSAIQFKSFNSDSEMRTYYQLNPTTFYVGISFNFSVPNVYGYTIRLPPGPNGNTSISTDILVSKDSDCRGKACPANVYNSSGVLGLMSVMDDAITQTIIERSSLKDRVNITAKLGEIFPSSRDLVVQKIGNPSAQFLIPIYTVVAFSIHVQGILTAMVSEKEKKLKEGLLMQGLRPEALWIGWIAWYGIYVFIAVITFSVALRFSVFPESDIIGLFLLIFIFGASNISFGKLLATFFRKAKVAAAVGGTIPIFASLLFVPFKYVTAPVGVKFLIACILYPVGLTLSLDDEFADRPDGSAALVGKGISLSGYFKADGKGLYFIAMLIYLDQVLPGEFGTPRPWFFPFTEFKKLFHKSDAAKLAPTYEDTSYPSTLLETNDEDLIGPNIEAEPTTLKKVGEIRELTKVFKDGKKDSVAVDKLSLNFYEGEIFALLGQNGAGKSTTINMLTGLYPPTSCKSGKLYGYDLRTEMLQIRQIMGVVPQQSILWENLNAEDHIRLIVKIKLQVTKSEEDDLVDEALRKAGLIDQRSTSAKSLSGGQKRKLSFAMAIVSNPKILILDEPSSALDPEARRDMWGLLMDNKDGRMCIITTHFMDEADFVANRKAVIGKGKLQCMGTSLFLKSHFKIGYQLDIAVTLKHQSADKAFISKIHEVITSHIPDATNLTGFDSTRDNASSDSTIEIDAKWSLPTAQAGKFAELFKSLDSFQHDGNMVSSFGVTMPTLEEVFLKQTEILERETNPDGALDHRSHVAPIPPKELTPSTSFTSQFVAMTRMRFITLVRQPKYLVLSVILPIIIFSISVGINKVSGNTTISSEISSNTVIVYTNPPYSKNTYSLFLPVQITGNDTNFTSQTSKDLLNTSDLKDFVKIQTEEKSTFGNVQLSVTIFEVGGKSFFQFNPKYFYNTTYTHSPAIMVNVISNLVLQGAAKKVSNGTFTPPVISAGLQPWSDAQSGLINGGIILSFVGVYLIAFSISISLTGYASELIRDRTLKIDEQLTIMGLSKAAYWLAAWSFHFTLTFVTLIGLFILVLAFGFDAFTIGPAPFILLLMMIFGIASLLLVFYFVSLFFEKGEQFQNLGSFLTFMLMVVPMVIVFICDILGQKPVGYYIHTILSLVNPFYPLSGGLYKMTYIGTIAKIGAPVPPFTTYKPITLENYFYPRNGILVSMLSAIFHFVVFAGILAGGVEGLMKRKRSWERKLEKKRTDEEADIMNIEVEDEDVVAERNRVLSMAATVNEEIKGVSELKVMQVSKTFRVQKSKEEYDDEVKANKNIFKRPERNKFVGAVKGITFAVRKGTMFSLLGPNGAGKSTLLSMAIGNIPTTTGKLSVITNDGEHSTNSLGAHKHTGYCPQHDALWPRLTVREHLLLFSGIKYIGSKEVMSDWVETVIEATGLKNFTNVWAEKLSGGNKRKLSFAVSIIGDPTLCFLDEPTTGVDPSSRRLIWNLILSAKSRRATILTTHAMEEADALSSQIGIMVNGTLKCIGTSQHLKSRFGLGFLLEILCDPSTAQDEQNTVDLNNFVKSFSPNARPGDSFQHIHRYEVPIRDVVALSADGSGTIDDTNALNGSALGKVFDILESAKNAGTCGVKEYAFGQTTLEQVFLRIAKEQKADATDAN